MANHRKFNRSQTIMIRVIAVTFLAQIELLTPLSNDSQNRVRYPRNRLRRHRDPVEVYAFQRLNGAICADSSVDTLDQLGSISLLPLCLMLSLLRIQQIHRNVFIHAYASSLRFAELYNDFGESLYHLARQSVKLYLK